MEGLIAQTKEVSVPVEKVIQEIATTLRALAHIDRVVDEHDIRERLEDYKLTDDELLILSMCALQQARLSRKTAKYRGYHQNPVNLSQLKVLFELQGESTIPLM